MRALFITYTILLTLPAFLAHAQVTANFSAPATGCLEQSIRLTNQSTNAVSFQWDFCPGELANSPTASLFATTGGTPFKVSVVKSEGEFTGFYTTRSPGKVFRLDFGSSISNIPVSVDLGDLGISSAALLSIELVHDGTGYYGLIVDFNNRIFRVAFGQSLRNTPATAELIYAGSLLNNPIDLVAQRDGSGSYAFIANYNAGSLVRLSFGAGFGTAVAGIVATPINHSFGGHGGLSLVRSAGTQQWNVIASTLNGSLVRVLLDDGLSDTTPVVSQMNVPPGLPTLLGLAVAHDNAVYYVFVQSATGLWRLALGSAISDTVLSTANLGSLGLFSNVWGFSMVKNDSDWLVLSSENSANRIYKITFPENCLAAPKASTAADPTIRTVQAGTFPVNLLARASDGSFATVTQTIPVASLVSPSVGLVRTNMCVDSNILFANQGSSANVVSFAWNFGDGNTSTNPAPSHLYSAAGDYAVQLIVQGDNGCVNRADSVYSIYPSPVASFTAPGGLICTQAEYMFTNTTPDVFEGNLMYEWSVDGSAAASTRDLSVTFSSPGTKTIQLTTSIPGCSSSASQSIGPVQTGPGTNFSFSGTCEDNNTVFTNTTTGSVTGYTWNFGDGNASTLANPTHVYTTPGTFQAMLSASSANGCVNTRTAVVTIRTVPQTNFSLDLPPFSCSGSPSQFRDATPPPADSNIQSWVWAFGDETAGTGTGPTPTYTYAEEGNYPVRLTTTTNFGCVGSLEKTISILPSPVVDFSFTPACVAQNTVFTESSSSATVAWQWTIGSSTYSVRNPTHRFSVPGSFSAQLRATAPNQCISMRTKTVIVPVLPALDFAVTNNCVNREARFEESNPGGADPATAWAWSFGDGGTGIGSPAVHSFNTSGPFAVRMEVTRQSGCIYSFTKPVTVALGPTASFVASPTVGPPPLNVAFTNTSANATSYLWRFNDAVNSTTTQPSPLFTFSETGSYLVELVARDNNGCEASSTQTIFAVVAAPDAWAVEAQLTAGAQPFTRRLALTVVNRGNVPLVNPVVLLHLAGGSKIQETLLTTLAPGATGVYELTTELLPGTQYLCAELAVPNDVDIANNRACINLETRSVFLLPYPNPASNDIALEMITSLAGAVRIECISTQGQRMWREEVQAQAGFNQWRVSVASLPAGIYFFRVSDFQQSVTHRIAVQR